MEHLAILESEAMYIIRETASQFGNPALMFSGGKDSTVLIHLAKKAFNPANIPFPVLHIDTGHNFPEAIHFRNQLAKEYDLQLIIRNVADTIRIRGLQDGSGKFPSRNPLQSYTLMDAIKELGFDACIGGGRRDEEKARAKERIFSVRDVNGAWLPHNQRPELWDVYNGMINTDQNVRIFPISNWSELDVWHYIRQEQISLPSLYYAHPRQCIRYNSRLIAISEHIAVDANDEIVNTSVRYRTVGDMNCTAAVESTATTIDEVIAEIAATRISERGETRMDDQFSDSAMEDRKMKGYF